MKNEQKYWVANSQEDEDGFSLNPYDVYIYESTNTDQNFSINKSGIISGTHDEIFTIIASKEKEMNTKQQSSKRIITIRKISPGYIIPLKISSHLTVTFSSSPCFYRDFLFTDESELNNLNSFSSFQFAVLWHSN